MLMVNPFFMMAGLYVTAGLFFAVLKGLGAWPDMPAPANLNWIRVHLITIGTITQVIFAALPSLLSRRLGIADRSGREAGVQWLLLNGGFVLVLVGLVGTDAWTGSIGAVLVLAAVWRLWTGLLGAWRGAGSGVGAGAAGSVAAGAAGAGAGVAIRRPLRASYRFYATAPAYLIIGIIMAIFLLFNGWSPGGRIGILEAHVHANVWGFLALIVAGMLFDLFPALAGGPMARPHWMGRVYWLLNIGAAGLVVGPWVNINAITIGGLLIYFVGTVMLLANLVLTLVQNRRVTPSSLHLVLAYLWMIVPAFFAPFILLAPERVDGPAVEAAATQGLVNGWVLGMVMGALPRVLRVWGKGLGFGSESAVDGDWVSVAALNLGVGFVWSTAVIASPVGDQVATLVGYGLIAMAWLPFLRRIWRVVLAV